MYRLWSKTMNQNNILNTDKWQNVKCPKCGKTNIGWQTNCLLCGANLSASKPQIELIYKCPSCNATIKKGQKFCTGCGNKLPKDLKAINEKSKAKECLKCGAKLKVGAKFCTQCGAKV